MFQPLQLTKAALDRVEFLIEEEQNPELKLRVYITGGGCSGFQYNFAFETLTKEDDTLINNSTEKGTSITVLLDSLSYPYLVGATIDYQSGLYGARFVVQNPNAKGTCGCGSSFSVAEE